MRKSSCALAATGLVAAVTLSGNTVAGRKPEVRSVEATWVGTILSPPADAKRVEVWIPLPSDGAYQTISDVKVEAPAPYTIAKDSAGNRVAHFVLDRPGQLGKDVEVGPRYRVVGGEAVKAALSERTAPADPATYLAANRLVPLTPPIRALSDRLAAGKTGAVEEA